MKRILTPIFMLLLALPVMARTEGHDHAAMMSGMNHDRMFADGMTKHHQDGIEMARMAVDKAQNAELRAMAQTMIDDQSREIDQMQALRPEGPKMSMAMMMDMPGMMSESQMKRDMERLRAATGANFDLAFTEIMSKHHDGAIMMSRHEIERGSIEGLKDIARGIAEKQTREREQLLALHEDMHEDATRVAGAREVRRTMTKD